MERFRQAVIGGAIVGAVAATIANLKEGFDEPEEGGGGLVAWLISLAILAVVTAIVWVVVTRLRRGGGEPNPKAGVVFRNPRVGWPRRFLGGRIGALGRSYRRSRRRRAWDDTAEKRCGNSGARYSWPRSCVDAGRVNSWIDSGYALR